MQTPNPTSQTRKKATTIASTRIFRPSLAGMSCLLSETWQSIGHILSPTAEQARNESSLSKGQTGGQRERARAHGRDSCRQIRLIRFGLPSLWTQKDQISEQGYEYAHLNERTHSNKNLVCQPASLPLDYPHAKMSMHPLLAPLQEQAPPVQDHCDVDMLDMLLGHILTCGWWHGWKEKRKGRINRMERRWWKI